MKKQIRQILEDKIVSLLTKIFVFLSVIFIIVSIWKWSSLPPEIPLFYSLPKSPDQLALSFFIIILPVLSLLFFITNFFLAVILYPHEKLASILLVSIGLINSVFLLIAYLKIILLVT